MKKTANTVGIAVLVLIAGVSLAWFVRAWIPSSSHWADGMSVYDFISEGDRLYEEQRYSEALTYYEQAAQKSPQDASVRMRIGQLYQIKNRFMEAEQEFRFAEQLDGTNPEIWYRLGCIYIELKYWDEAREYLERTLAEVRDTPMEKEKVRYPLGLASLWLSEYDAAEAHFQLAAEVESDNTQQAKYYWGLLVSRRDRAQAKAILGSLVAQYPDTDIASKAQKAIVSLDDIDATADETLRILKTGVVYLEHLMPTLATEYFTQVIQRQPDYQSAHYYLGYAYFLAGDVARAQDELEGALDIGGKPAALNYYYLGKLYAYEQEWSKAAEAFERAVDGGETSYDVYINLGHVLRQTGEYSKAVKAYKLAREVQPDELGVYRSLVYLYTSTLKDMASALEVARQAVERQPDTALSHSILGW
ncbi:MAG TPA: tetratricopeptide repeat protein, partial [bacterium]|nr:tetratricopeptide repeat protein [bacterium]